MKIALLFRKTNCFGVKHMKKRCCRLLALLLCLAMFGGIIEPYRAKAEEETHKRYIVLVVDTAREREFESGASIIYTSKPSINEVKKASMHFADALTRSSGNQMAIVSFADTAKVELGFSNDLTVIKQSIGNISETGMFRNMASGLEAADELLAKIPDNNADKTIILISPGMTDYGEYDETGHWRRNPGVLTWYNKATGVPLYQYANRAYACAESIKKHDITIYTIGLLTAMDECPYEARDIARFFQTTLSDLANQNCYYPVYDINDFSIIFSKMGEEIIGGSEGRFKFPGTDEKGDTSATFYFEDGYFDGPATTYNPSLATMSMCLALSAFGSNEAKLDNHFEVVRINNNGESTQFVWSDGVVTTENQRMCQWTNAYNLLDAIGFRNIETNEYFSSVPEMNSMGVIVGMKTMESSEGEFTLIALATRGGNYYSEWAGNLNVGKTGNHSGFSFAQREAQRFLDEYVTKHKSDIVGETKLWMAGYSRGGATVNLLAGDVTERCTVGTIGEVSLIPNNIYAYCFEPPRGLHESNVTRGQARTYNNIFNVVNPNDPVPLVAMEKWGFIRYGIDILLPESRYTQQYNADAERMMRYYSAFDSKGVKTSYISATEYLSHYEEVLKGPRESVYSFYEQDKALLDGPTGNPTEEEFEKEWEPIRKTIESGTRFVKYHNWEIDMQDYSGYGIFDTLYEYMNGMIGVKNHLLSSDVRQNDYISLIDLYHRYDYGNPITDILGIKNILSESFKIDYLNTNLQRDLWILVSGVANSISRNIYKRDIQTWLCKAIDVFMKEGMDAFVKFRDERFKTLKRVRKAFLLEMLSPSNWGKLIVALPPFFMDRTGPLVELAYDILDDVIKKDLMGIYHLNIDKIYQTHFSVDEMALLKDGLKELIQAVVSIATNREGSNALLSLVQHGDKLLMAHYPELCLAWLQSQDKNYHLTNQRFYVPNLRRTIVINCPVDVVVYNSNNSMVAEIIDDCPIEIPGSSIFCAFTEDGEKCITLPMDEDYYVEIIATDNGRMDTSVRLYDTDGECRYIENYYDISIVENQRLSLYVPKLYYVESDGTEQEYLMGMMVNDGEGGIPASVTLEGDSAIEAVHRVSVLQAEQHGGVACGGGDYVLGSYALITAIEYEDCAFLGWYQDGVLVSTEREYRFRVTEDCELQARFSGESKYGRNGIFSASLVAESGGYILGKDHLLALDGYSFEISAEADEGYEFTGWEADGNCLMEDSTNLCTHVTLIDEDVVISAKFREASKSEDDMDNGEDISEETGEEYEGYESAQGDIMISYRTDATWTGGFNGTITIQNNSEIELKDWMLLFDSDAQISGAWNANLDMLEEHYSITAYDWNRAIPPGQSVSIGFTGAGDVVFEPENYVLLVRKHDSNQLSGDIRFEKTGEWVNGCTGAIVFTNNTGSDIRGWAISFQFDGRINDTWNGKVDSYIEGCYTIVNPDNSNMIRPGETIRIGVNLTYGGVGKVPQDFTITGR